MNATEEKILRILRREFAMVRRSIAVGGHNGIKQRRVVLQRERILRVVGAENQVSQRKLAEYFSVRPQSMSEALRKLERDGCIVRQKNPEDRRQIQIRLTEKGRWQAEEFDTSQTRRMIQLFAPLTQQEKETLLLLLEKMFGTMEE